MAARAILLLTTASLLALAAGAAAEKRSAPPKHAETAALGAAAGPTAASKTTTSTTANATPIDFNRDVRPILSDRCFGCHGPDAERGRRAGLRLDTADGSRATLASGARAIVPGDLDTSEAVRRILSEDPDEIMPPPELKRPLSAEERATLVRWIAEGAEYKPHWAFVAPVAPDVARVVGEPGEVDAWTRDPIDVLVRARFEAAGLAPEPEADRATLLRRASLALTGLPPTPEEVDAFIADATPDAYEKRVDAMLATPRAAEHRATVWLDLARFADTFGYQSDFECRTWPWRDW
ncbi:MAG: DUF1549 domain-containing protein, partial [bacterium]